MASSCLSKTLVHNAALKMVVLKKYGSINELDVIQCPSVPEPGAGQLVVRIHACGMNFADLYTRVGLFQDRKSPRPPFTMGREAAGEVISIGSGQRSFKVGDRVACLSPRQGLWADVAVVEDSDAIHLPVQMSYEDGAAFFVNFVTAFSAVQGFGSLRSGHKVFIHSVGGGVGCAATQLVKLTSGVTVMGTSSSEKHEKLKELGVDNVFEPDSDYIEQVLRLYPEGVDLILDNRSGREFQSARKMLGPLGKIVHLGANSVLRGQSWGWMSLIRTFWEVRSVSLLDLIGLNQGVCGLNIDELKLKSPVKYGQIVEELKDLYCQGKIKPRVDSVWPLDEVQTAMGKLISRENIGKILLKPSSDWVNNQ